MTERGQGDAVREGCSYLIDGASGSQGREVQPRSLLRSPARLPPPWREPHDVRGSPRGELLTAPRRSSLSPEARWGEDLLPWIRSCHASDLCPGECQMPFQMFFFFSLQVGFLPLTCFFRRWTCSRISQASCKNTTFFWLGFVSQPIFTGRWIHWWKRSLNTTLWKKKEDCH